MNGVAAGSWSDGAYAIVRTADWAEAIMSVVENDLGKENVTKEQLLVAIWEFLCFFYDCRGLRRGLEQQKSALRHGEHAGSAVDHAFSSSARFWQLHLWVANSAYGSFPLRVVLCLH